MKLKVDEQGRVVVEDGKPVYVHEDGREVPFDAPATVATIARLNGEAKAHREAKEAAEGKLKAFEGIEDPAAARQALETVKNFDEGKLVTAGKVDEIKQAAARAAEERVAAQSKLHADEITTLRGEIGKLTSEYHGEKIANAFKGSKFIGEKAAIPGDLMEARFGAAFKIEDGRIIGHDKNGNKIFSTTHPGEVAEFDEALESLVNAYPFRDSILKGNNSGGSGSRNNPSGAGNPDLMKLPPTARIDAIRAQRKV